VTAAGDRPTGTLGSFLDLSRAFFSCPEERGAQGYLVALLALAFGVGALQVVTSYVGRDFMTAIEKGHAEDYWRLLGLYLGCFALAVPVGVYYRWTEKRLALRWREWLAGRLVERYFNNRAYYRLRGVEGIDNPDQRISEDVLNFTDSSLSFLLIALNAGVTLVAFLGVLWGISGTLVLILFAYAGAGTAISILIGRRLVRLHFRQYQKEADFRYGLVRVRDNAESIAFYRGERREKREIAARLKEVVVNFRLIIDWSRNLSLFTTAYNYAAIVLPVMIVAPMFMRGEVEFGVITQAAAAFAHVLAAVSLVITKFEGISSYLAGAQRLATLWGNLDTFDADEERAALEADGQLDEESSVVRLRVLDICTPDPASGSRTLVSNLSFELHRKQGLLLMGASGTGKSSVMRTIAGLWPSGDGHLERPPLRQLMFLPQRPYMVQGTLRDQLLYPYPETPLEDAFLRKIVAEVNLRDVFARVNDDLDRTVDWTNVLSIGEQQRIAFARLFLRKPRFGFLDEATSALDEENQETLYRLLRRSGVGFVSVGHRSSLTRFHDRVLTLDIDGTWTIEDNPDLDPGDPLLA
jgi:putative ATP-binding cassette transporter